MSIVDARFVEVQGKKIIQLKRSLWGGEGSEWFTPATVPLGELRSREQGELADALGIDLSELI